MLQQSQNIIRFGKTEQKKEKQKINKSKIEILLLDAFKKLEEDMHVYGSLGHCLFLFRDFSMFLLTSSQIQTKIKTLKTDSKKIDLYMNTLESKAADPVEFRRIYGYLFDQYIYHKKNAIDKIRKWQVLLEYTNTYECLKKKDRTRKT